MSWEEPLIPDRRSLFQRKSKSAEAGLTLERISLRKPEILAKAFPHSRGDGGGCGATLRCHGTCGIEPEPSTCSRTWKLARMSSNSKISNREYSFQEYSPNLDSHERITQIKQNVRMARFTEAVTVCQAFHEHYCMSFSWQPYKVNATIIPILSVRKLRLREIR